MQGGESPLRAPQVANGKPLFPSLQTAMVTPKEATGVNFINVLITTFTLVDPKSVKNTVKS